MQSSLFITKIATILAMKYIYLFFLTFSSFTFSIFPLHSQIPVTATDLILDKLRLNKGIAGRESTPYSSITGDPYVFKNFKKGFLVVSNGEKADVNIRYDIYADEMHLNDNNQIYAIIHPEKVKFIEVEELKFVYSNYVKGAGDKSPSEGSYFILKVDGNCQLLIKKNIRIQDAEPPKLYQDAKPAKFINLPDTYYLKEQNKSAIQIKSKNVLLSFMEPQKDKMVSFINTEKLGIKKVEDLEKIISFYNSLQ